MMDGRVRHEIITSSAAPEKLKVQRKIWLAKTSDGSYSVTLRAAMVVGHRSVDEVRAAPK